jgi:hypothetical protein
MPGRRVIVEQRNRGCSRGQVQIAVTQVAVRFGVSRQSARVGPPLLSRAVWGRWLTGPGGRIRARTRLRTGGGACEIRREHPKWGQVRIAHELGWVNVAPAPSRMSVYRVPVRHGPIEPDPPRFSTAPPIWIISLRGRSAAASRVGRWQSWCIGLRDRSVNFDIE